MAEQQQPLQKEPTRKLGTGVLQAAIRQGFKELGNITEAFPTSTPTVDEPGQMFNIPPQGVSQQTGFSQPVSVNRAPQPSLIDKHLADIGVSPIAVAAPAMHTPQTPDSANRSLIDKHLQDIQMQAPEIQQPDMELDK